MKEDDVLISSRKDEVDPSEQQAVFDVEKQLKILAELNNIGKVKSIPLKEVFGHSKEEIKKMSAFAKVANAKESPTPEQAKKDKVYKEIYGDNLASFKEAGYEVKFVENKELETRAAVLIKGDEVIVSFRGTQNSSNVASDLKTGLITSSFMEGRVHNGFYDVFKSLWPDIRKEIDTYAHEQGKSSEDLQFKFTGHSLGGAIAKIAAWFVYKEWGVEPNNIDVVTFADPRVFDAKQADEYNKALGDKTLTVAQKGDVIPKLSPGAMGYKHVGAKLKIAEDETMHKLESYAKGIDKIDKEIKVNDLNNSVSFFYYPSKLFQYLNELIFGTIQHLIRGEREGFAQKEEKARNEANEKLTKPENELAPIKNKTEAKKESFTEKLQHEHEGGINSRSR
ncbi:MAG: putative lipase [Candidatus Midichloriaceae bacterium]|jgi:hypothetical protein|nr:putative lipase [Candidatus Midichloriaceae bacterium]